MTDDLLLERVPTGVPGLDTILRGGFLKGGVYIIEGVPGTGKTILANQICFSHIAGGGRALFVTLLAESHTRMLQHLRPMSFFDEAAIPSTLYYVSALRALEVDGLGGLVDLLHREIRTHKATLVVLDGLLAAEQSAATEREFKKFIGEIQAHVTAQECTALLLTNGSPRPVRPEETMVDGLIALSDQLYGARAERDLQVRKFRGSGSLRGRHSFRITPDGVVVYPRFEALYAAPSRPDEPDQGRIGTGVDQLDAMFKGGLPAASTTTLIGPSGAGKTTLGLHFLSQCSEAEPGLLFGFFETPARLRMKAEALDIEFGPLVDRGVVEIMWQAPTEHILDALAHRLLEAAQRRNVRRLFVDGLGGFVSAATDKGRISHFFAALANELRALGVSTIYTMEARDLIGTNVVVPVDNISSLIENLIYLRFVERESQLSHILSILKARDSDFDPTIRPFSITSGGIRIGEPFRGAEDIMSGFAHRPSGGAGRDAAEAHAPGRPREG
jgi:circadian clock protein KaiC